MACHKNALAFQIKRQGSHGQPQTAAAPAATLSSTLAYKIPAREITKEQFGEKYNCHPAQFCAG
jgi:hypothetical protein